MKTIAITGTLRSDLGKIGAKEARKNELVPCVMYGAGKQVHFTMEQKSFDKIVYTADVYNVLITVDGTEYSTFLKASQFHPVTDAPVHADFIILEDGKPVTVALPVTLTGVAIGVKNGGKLQTPMRKVTVKGNLADIPEKVEVEISPLKIGMSIKVGTMNVNGLEFLDPASNVVVAVKTARGAVDEEEEEAAEGTEEATPAEGAEA